MSAESAPGTVNRSRPLIIVMNRGSGRGAETDRERDIAEGFAAAGQAYRLLRAPEPSALPAVAKQAVAIVKSGGGAVVAAGGDGTINTVVQAVLPSGVPFGVLPQGTYNYFGRDLGIPEDPKEAIRALLGARTTSVQVGLMNDRAFLVNASLGAYPRLLEQREEAKRRFGRSRVVATISGVASLLRAHRTMDMTIELGGKSRDVQASMLFVGNNRLQLDQVGLPQAEDVDHGQLAAVAVKPVGRLSMLRLLLRGALGELGNAENVIDFSFHTMRVHTRGRRRVKVATDGEVSWMKTPIVFRVAPQKLNMLVPENPTRATE